MMNRPQNGSEAKSLYIGTGQSSCGVYENIPGRLNKGPPSTSTAKDTNISSLTNATMSGGVNRNVRAKSEKREIVDSWFSRSFAKSGGLNYRQGYGEDDKEDNYEEARNGNNANNKPESSRNNGDSNDPEVYGSFMDRKRAFENLIAQTKQSGNNVVPPTSSGNRNVSSTRARMSMSPGEMLQSPAGVPHENNEVAGSPGKKSVLPYRGCKTTSNADEAGDWDFLSTLNDILRQENFIGDSYLQDNQNSFNTKNPHTSSSHHKSIIINGNGPYPSPSSSANLNYIPNPVPLSPRPPRPVRKADRRREYAKARSMDIAHLASSANISGTNDFDSLVSTSQMSSCASPRNVMVESVMTPLPMNIFNPQPYTGQSQTPTGNGRCVSPYQNVPSVPPTSLGANDLSQGRMMDHHIGKSSCTSPVPIRHPAISSSSPLNGLSNDSSGITSSRPMTPSRKEPQVRMDESESNNIYNGPRPPLSSPPPLAPHRLPVSPLLQMNPMSSSLDSIYDRLKVTSEYHDPAVIGRTSPSTRPVTQLYEGKGGSGIVYEGGRYPMAPIPHQLYYGYGNYYNSSSNPSFFGSGRLDFDPSGWSKGLFYSPEYDCMIDRYGYPVGPRLRRDDSKGRFSPTFANGGGGTSKSANNTGSLPRLWNKMPEYRSRSFGSLKGSLLGLDYEDRLVRLETDKETLHLQVSCLSDQIEAQTDKIKDLEKCLDDKKNVLETTEDQLQRELLTRSSLETQKLQLLTEISTLRLKQASLERENVELKERYQPGKSMGDLSYTDGPLPHRIWDKPPLVPLNAPMRSSSPSFQDPRIRLGSNGSEHTSQQQVIPPNRVRTPPANAYRRVDASAFGTVPRRSPHSSQIAAYNGQLSTLENGLGESGQGSKGNGTSGKTNSLSSGNINVISNYNNPGSNSDHKQLNNMQFQCVPVHVPSRPFPPPKLSIAPYSFLQGDESMCNTFYPHGHIPSNSSSAPTSTTTTTASGFRVFDRSVGNSIAFMSGGASVYQSIASPGVVGVSPSGAFTLGSRFRSRSSSRALPTTTTTHVTHMVHSQDTSGCTTTPFTPHNTRSTSTPNLAALEKQEWERKSSGNVGGVMNGKNTKSSPNSGGHKSRGIMRIFGKLRRSNSGGLDNDQIAPAETIAGLPSGPAPGGPFTRGGLRATAQPRLGWVKEPSPPKKPEGPITSWDSDNVVLWLNYVGLGMYAGDVKRWVKTGQQLLDASPQELEKELGVKNYLHRKKLILALNAFKKPEEDDNAGKLDYHWVIRWLDDVGLPQYKESFGEARVDGRVLSYLTTEDLISLKVTSVLHHASMKRGIQLLRIHKFHPDCLCRRGGPTPGGVQNNRGSDSRIGNNNGSNGSGDYGSSDGSSGGNLWGPKQVATWTNHRVMEWLKAIDLAEYAPNLRGSGVHGALIIFEARFNSELMATLLSIPANKTLLRRHLCLQINELVGKHIVQEKRTAEIAQDFVPINPTTKVKVSKKAQFPPLRKKRFSTDFAAEELLCPLDLSVYPFHSDSLGQLSSLDNSLDGNTTGDKVSNII